MLQHSQAQSSEATTGDQAVQFTSSMDTTPSPFVSAEMKTTSRSLTSKHGSAGREHGPYRMKAALTLSASDPLHSTDKPEDSSAKSTCRRKHVNSDHPYQRGE